MDFACELMDLCRGTQEVEAVLSEGSEENGSRDPLARLKMAMEYEEKKVWRLTEIPCVHVYAGSYNNWLFLLLQIPD